MAITYTRIKYDKPTVALSLVAGGSLEPNTTYYYRVATANNNYWASVNRMSPASDVQYITTDTTNLSIKIDITHSTGNPEYTFIWVSKGVDPGTGGWNDHVNFPDCWYLGWGSYNMPSSGNAKIDTLTDDGVTLGWFSVYYNLDPGTGANYGYVIFSEHGRDHLIIDGSTDLDPVSFDTIYDEAVLQGWPLESTIEPVDLVPADQFILDPRRVYMLHFKELEINSYFKDADKLIVLVAGDVFFDGETYIGTHDAATDLTNDGIDFLLTGHGVSFGNVHFRSASRTEVFDSTVKVRKATFSLSTAYGARWVIGGTDWLFRDCVGYGPGGYRGFNNGMEVNGADPGGTSLLHRVASWRGRYTGDWTAANPFLADDLMLGTIAGSGCWVRHTDFAQREFSNVEFRGEEGVANSLVGSVKFGNSVNLSRAQFTDCYLYDFDRIYWYWWSPGTPFEDTSYFKFRYSISLRVLDVNGDPVVGAAVVVENANGDEEFNTTTGGDGTIADAYVLKYLNKPDPAEGASHTGGLMTDYGPFTMTVTMPEFEPYIHIFDTEEAIDWSITLLPSGAVQAQGINASIEDDIRAEV